MGLEVIKQLKNIGLPASIIALGIFIVFLMNGHQQERILWKADMEKDRGTMIETVRVDRQESTKALINNTTALTELVTIIKLKK